MSTDTRTGFRLPWSSDRSSQDERPAPDAETPAPDSPEEASGAEPELRVPDAPEATEATEATEAAADAATPADADGGTATDDARAADGAAAWPDADAAWPDTDLRRTPEAPAAAPGTPPRPQPHRRPTRFLADLTAAMRAAAEANRAETLAQFQADTKTVVAGIHDASAVEASELRRRTDADVAGIREWSKAEIARIREETDRRIADRKATLERELETHAADIERRIEQVHGAVAAFEREMADFMDGLLAETDPTRFAALAEAMPEPPSLGEYALPASDAVAGAVDDADDPSDVAPESVAAELVTDASADDADGTQATAAGWPASDVEDTAFAATVDVPEAMGATDAEPGTMPDTAPDMAADTAPEGLGEDDRVPNVDRSEILAALEAAAEAVVAAEAAAESANQAEEAADLAETAAELLSSRIDDGDGWADLDGAEAEAALSARIEAGGVESESFVDRLAGLTARAVAGDGEPGTTQVVVGGLVSVASIASFKRHLGRVAGVRSVSVSSGPDGDFVFTAVHGPEVSFRDVIPTLPGFGARVTSASDGLVHVTAHDPESDA